MNLFWGLISIREFNYRFKHSVAYYELLTLDAPYTDYDFNDKENKQENIVDDEAIRKNMEALERAKERDKNRKV